MTVINHLSAILGLDIGGINTRVSLMGIADGKYRLLGSQPAATSLGQGLHIGAGVGEAMQAVQKETGHPFIKEEGGLLQPVDRIGRGVDRVGMVLSAGPRVRAALLGLTSQGSIKAGQALFDSLPLRANADFGMAHLANTTRAVETLIKSRPDILVIAGGEDAGGEDLTMRWIDIVCILCQMLPEAVQPLVVYAGSPGLEGAARRWLEPVARLQVVPNLQPVFGEYDLVPAAGALEQEVLHKWQAGLPGLKGLSELAHGLTGLSAHSMDRMVRFLSLTRQPVQDQPGKTGILAVDLGGIFTTVSAGVSGQSGTVVDDKFPAIGSSALHSASLATAIWAGEPVTEAECERFLANHALIPAWVPQTGLELALSHAFTRYRLQQALQRLSAHYDWFDFHPEYGLRGTFEPVIASGAVLNGTRDAARVMLTLLDGLQPHGITTLVLDRYNILPLLGKIGEVEPILPVQVLSSSAFENLGTVISASGRLPSNRTALTVHMETASGKKSSHSVPSGSLLRLTVAEGERADLDLIPHNRVDIGFGWPGQRGRLRVTGGNLGVVLDARGRPLLLPEPTDARVALLQTWLQALRAEHNSNEGA